MAKILEHHTKQLLGKNGILVPAAEAIDSLQALDAVAASVPLPWMIKALVPMGKKGKAGLVRPAPDIDTARSIASEMLGTEKAGCRIDRLLVENRCAIQKELFVSITYDNLSRTPVILFSTRGGMEIEQLVRRHPQRLFRREINIVEGFHAFQARSICFEAGLDKSETAKVAPVLVSIYALFYSLDARLLEINPLAITETGEVCAVGTLLNVDDEALFRHPELAGIAQYGAERSLSNLTEREKMVVEADLAAPGSGAVRYTEFADGDIAFNIVGGGASLIAMDAIIRCGGRPANYSDVGPGKGSKDKMVALLQATLTKPGIKAFITGANIIGASDISGIGEGVAQTLKMLAIDPLKIPTVARWAGIGEENARKAFEAIPGLHYFGSEVSIEEAAEKIVELVKAGHIKEGTGK